MMYTIERKAEIISLLKEKQSVDVNWMAEHFKTSKETIRRDLRELEAEGAVHRTHGGAVLAAPAGQEKEYPVMVRGMQQYAEKNAICRRAASLVSNGDTIFVDNSSTCLNLLKYIDPSLQITVITNSLQLLMESAKLNYPGMILVCLGGIFSPGNYSIYGNLSMENAKVFYPNKAFVSCAGLSSEKITDNSVYEAETKGFLVRRSKETILLADHTKFCQNGGVHFMDLDQVDVIVTDGAAEKNTVSFPSECRASVLFAELHTEC